MKKLNNNPKIFNQLMIDIETMGIEPYSCITSISAVEFDIESGETGKEFFINIDLEDSMKNGFTVNADTILWWMKQSDDARKDVFTNTVDVLYALHLFSVFCKSKDYEVWANSPRFDCGILSNYYTEMGLKTPWNFRKERCVRTLQGLFSEIKEQTEFEGVKHNPLSDCYHQIKYCHKIWNIIKK